MSKDRYAISSLNPHTHAGCDISTAKLSILLSLFQSTHPRRVWPSCWLLCIILIKFQSTHPRRVWPGSPRHVGSSSKFQSTHPRRVWHSLNAKWEKGGSFNPHTHAGCDEEIWRRLYVQSCFNPHTHAGCDQKKWTVLTIKNSFNPHTHAGCDIVW